MTDAPKDLCFRILFDAAADVMLLAGDSGCIMLANPAAQQLFGYTEDELFGLTVEMLMPPRYRKRHRAYRKSFINKPEKRAMVNSKGFAALKRGGKVLTLDISLGPIKTSAELYILITFNIADRRLEAEEALRASKERLRLAEQSAGFGVFDYDYRHNIIY